MMNTAIGKAVIIDKFLQTDVRRRSNKDKNNMLGDKNNELILRLRRHM